MTTVIITDLKNSYNFIANFFFQPSCQSNRRESTTTGHWFYESISGSPKNWKNFSDTVCPFFHNSLWDDKWGYFQTRCLTLLIEQFFFQAVLFFCFIRRFSKHFWSQNDGFCKMTCWIHEKYPNSRKISSAKVLGRPGLLVKIFYCADVLTESLNDNYFLWFFLNSI